jgi:aerobic-type carbon monoxide dehydrogenase small subunit (CoxS/CutS family)
MPVKSHQTTRKKPAETRRIHLKVNHQDVSLEVGSALGQIDAAQTLAQTLRETLGLTGNKVSCDHGACGACTVLIDGEPRLSCLTLTVECDGRAITTIEGLAGPRDGALDPLQQAFIDHNAFQCGFCTPGLILSARALLDGNPSPTEDQVKEALSGNFCRCISHYQVVQAVLSVSAQER